MATMQYVLAVVLWTLFCGMEAYDVPFAFMPVALMALFVGPWRSRREFVAEYTRPFQRSDLKAIGFFVAVMVLITFVVYLLPSQLTDYVLALAMVWLGVVAMPTRHFLKCRETPEKPQPG
jgi:hypothetical protein